MGWQGHLRPKSLGQLTSGILGIARYEVGVRNERVQGKNGHAIRGESGDCDRKRLQKLFEVMRCLTCAGHRNRLVFGMC